MDCIVSVHATLKASEDLVLDWLQKITNELNKILERLRSAVFFHHRPTVNIKRL